MLSDKEVLHIAKLSNLKLTDEEVQRYKAQLSSVLDYVKKLQKVDTDGVEPTMHAVQGIQNRFQDPKKSKQTLKQKEVLSNAKETIDGYISTQAVL